MSKGIEKDRSQLGVLRPEHRLVLEAFRKKTAIRRVKQFFFHQDDVLQGLPVQVRTADRRDILRAVHHPERDPVCSQRLLPFGTMFTPEMDTVANANVPLATFLRRFYTRVLVGQVQPGQRPLIVDVERVGRKNRIENYKLVVGFVASDTQMALVHGPFDYRAAVEGFTIEDRLKYSNYTGDLSKLYDSENMLTDDHIDGILQTMVRRKDILVVPTNISEHPERATRKGVPFFQNFLDKSGNEAQKHVLVPINHSCHWYLLHYDVEKNAFARANSIEDTKNVGKERNRVVSSKVLPRYPPGREGNAQKSENVYNRRRHYRPRGRAVCQEPQAKDPV